MKRTELREHIFKLLFRSNFFGEEEMQEQGEMYTEELESIEDGKPVPSGRRQAASWKSCRRSTG